MTTSPANDNSPLLSIRGSYRPSCPWLELQGAMGRLAATWEREGLPRIDPMTGCRYWPAVRVFLDRRHGLGQAVLTEHGGRRGELALTDFPGLKRKRNKDGAIREYWAGRADLIARGFRPSSIRLHYPDTPDGRKALSARCHILQAEMLAWASRGGEMIARLRPGTIKSLSRLFQVGEDSPYRSMKWNSRNNVTKYLGIIEKTVGSRQVGKLLGPDFKLGIGLGVSQRKRIALPVLGAQSTVWIPSVSSSATA